MIVLRVNWIRNITLLTPLAPEHRWKRLAEEILQHGALTLNVFDHFRRTSPYQSATEILEEASKKNLENRAAPRRQDDASKKAFSAKPAHHSGPLRPGKTQRDRASRAASLAKKARKRQESQAVRNALRQN